MNRHISKFKNERQFPGFPKEHGARGPCTYFDCLSYNYRHIPEDVLKGMTSVPKILFIREFNKENRETLSTPRKHMRLRIYSEKLDYARP